MIKKLLLIVSFIALGIGIYITHINSYVKYTPITHYGYGYRKAPEINTVAHKNNLKKVLNDNKVEWKLQEGEIYIKRKWFLNKKAINNFTDEANEAEYVKYVPVVLEDPNIGFEIVPDLTVNIDNLKLVLSYHDEKWKIENGQLFITQRLALDKEMIHNYTRMANDEEYVEQIK